MPESVKAIFDNSIEVSDGLCAVALAVKKGENSPNHAFIIIQSMNASGESSLKTYNFGLAGGAATDSSSSMTINDGAVWGKNAVELDEKGMESFFKTTIMGSSNYDCVAFSVTEENLAKLNKRVAEDKNNPPKYFSSGGDSSGARLFNEPSHNCLSWACEILRETQCVEENELPRSSLLLNSPREYIPRLIEQRAANENPASSCCIIS